MAERFIITVIGRAGAGKSTLIRRMIYYCLPRPVFVIDSMDEYSMGLSFESSALMAHYIAAGRPNVSGVYVAKVSDDDDANLFWHFIERLKEPCTIVVDEASKYCNPYTIHDSLKRLISYGRHWNASLILAARRPSELHRDVTAQSNAIVSFRQDEPRDVAMLRQIYTDAQRLPHLSMPRDGKGGEYVALGDWRDTPIAKCLDPVNL